MPKYSLTLIDAYGRTTSKLLEVEEQALLADYVTLAGALMTELAAITDLGLVRMDLIIPIDESFAVTAGANKDTGGTFSGYLDAVPFKKASLKVPGIKPSKVAGDGTIPLDDVDVAAWLARYEAGAGDLMLSDGEQIDTWLSGTLDK